MRYIIVCYSSTGFLFGNRSITTQEKLARRFDTELEANSYIRQWFAYPPDFEVKEVSE